MDYKLAKQLKDAGFPQAKAIMDIDRWVDSGKITHEDYTDISVAEFEKKQDRCFTPTLSELIEACGGKNFRLMADSTGNWSATSFIHAKHGEGETPEIAVANLWLELHKK